MLSMDKKFLKILGHNIKVERVKQDYTQEKLAELSGIQMQHLSKIEKGECNIKFLTLIAILKGLNVPFESLFNINSEN